MYFTAVFKLLNGKSFYQHISKHACFDAWSELNGEKKSVVLKDNPNIKPAELQSACILSTIRQQCDWRDVEKQAEATLDKQWISNEKKKLKKDRWGWAIFLAK